MLRHFHGLYSHRPYIALHQSAREDSLSYCKISVFLFIIKQKKQGWFYSREYIYIYIYIFFFNNISKGTDSLVVSASQDAGGHTLSRQHNLTFGIELHEVCVRTGGQAHATS